MENRDTEMQIVGFAVFCVIDVTFHFCSLLTRNLKDCLELHKECLVFKFENVLKSSILSAASPSTGTLYQSKRPHYTGVFTKHCWQKKGYQTLSALSKFLTHLISCFLKTLRFRWSFGVLLWELATMGKMLCLFIFMLFNLYFYKKLIIFFFLTI